MSLVTTPRFTLGHRCLLNWSTSAVFPLPTGPAIPTRYALTSFSLKQKIPLRQRQYLSGFAGEQLAIGAHFVSLRIDFDPRHCGVVDHVLLTGSAAVANRGGLFTEQLPNPRVEPGARYECQRRRGGRSSKSAKHRPVQHGLRRRNRCVGVTHHAPGDESSFYDNLRLYTEHRGLPEHQVRQFARVDRPDFMRNPMRDRRIDRVLRDISLHPEVVSPRRILRQGSALRLHFVRRLPG